MSPRSSHERNHRLQGKWLSNARMWSATTRRLIDAPDAGQNFLTGVTFYLAVHCACVLVTDRNNVPAD
ncbi:MAG: hypothetical protein JO352_35935 [Chloroflexi bacterium]|nr:hypothetical protein [Chloroflexota bacterium]MBV9598822.1 hypothetical protein [Chloroflexota bacterium]